MEDIAYAIFDCMSVIEITIFGQVNRFIYQLSSTDKYWCRRSHNDGLISVYLNSSSLTKSPKLRYAWSVLKIQNTPLDVDLLTFIVFNKTQIHVSDDKDYLLLCNILGLNQALLLAAETNNINFVTYIVSLGPYPYIIKEAIILALDLDHKDFAFKLSEISHLWDHYYAKYNPKSGPVDDLFDYIFGLTRYCHYDQLISMSLGGDFPDIQIGSLKIFHYLTGLITKGAHDFFLEELETNASNLTKSPIQYHVNMFRAIIKFGTVRLLMKTVDIISEGEIWGNLLSAALDENRVDVMKYLLFSVDKESMVRFNVIRSIEVFNLLRQKLPKAKYDSFHRAILHSHNYRLLKFSLQIGDWEKVDVYMSMTPFMVKIAMDECENRGLPIRKDAMKGVNLYLIGCFMYNFLRSTKCEVRLDELKEWISWINFTKGVDLDHLPYLKADLAKIGDN